MKTLVKKCGAAGVVAAAVFALILAAGCPVTPEDYQVPDGYGAVQMNFNLNNGRSILPPDAKLDDIVKYDFYFKAEDLAGGNPGELDGEDATFTDVAKANREVPLPLKEGRYTLKVVGYVKTDNGDEAAVEGEGINKADSNRKVFAITISHVAGNELPIFVELFAYDPGASAGNGVFKYNIHYDIKDGTLGDSTMRILTLDKTPTVNIGTWAPGTPATFTLTAGSPAPTAPDATYFVGDYSSTMPLASNYYLAELEIKVINRISGLTETFRSLHVLQVYKGLTSIFDYSFEYDGATGMAGIVLFVKLEFDDNWEVGDLLRVEPELSYVYASDWTPTGATVITEPSGAYKNDTATLVPLTKANAAGDPSSKSVAAIHLAGVTGGSMTYVDSYEFSMWIDSGAPGYKTSPGDFVVDVGPGKELNGLLFEGRQYPVCITIMYDANEGTSPQKLVPFSTYFFITVKDKE